MRYVCNIDMVGSPAKDDDPHYPCKYFSDFLNSYPLPETLKFDKHAYNVRRDTHRGSVHALLKYDVELPPITFDKEMFEEAILDTLEDFSALENKGKIRTLNEVKIVPDGSSGVTYKRMDVPTRQDVLETCPETISWFWEYAHKADYPVLWKEFGKVELLKVAKEIRGLSNPPTDFHMCSAAMTQHTNELLSALGRTDLDQPCRVGMTMQGGGLDAFCHFLDQLGAKIASSDADRWDARLLAILFDAIKRIRYMIWDKQGMSEEEWWERMNYYYAQKVYSYLVASNGQVFQKKKGNSSGQDSTSYDNTWAHDIIKNYIWRWITKAAKGRKAYFEKKRDYRYGLYGDDNIEAIMGKFGHLFTYEERASIYAQFGMSLSKAKDVFSDSVEGHVWLGKTIKKVGNHYVGLVNPEKVLCSLLNLESKSLEPELVYTRAMALMVESTWTEPLQTVVRDFVIWLRAQGVFVKQYETEHEQWFAALPSLATCKAFWLGEESTGYDFAFMERPDVREFLSECYV